MHDEAELTKRFSEDSYSDLGQRPHCWYFDMNNSKYNWQEHLFSCSGRNYFHSPASWRTTFSLRLMMHTVWSQNCLLLKWKPSGCQTAVITQRISGSAHLTIAYRAQTGEHLQPLGALRGGFSVART